MNAPYTGTADRYGTLGQQDRDDAAQLAIEKRAAELCRGTLMDMADIMCIDTPTTPDALTDELLTCVQRIFRLGDMFTGDNDMARACIAADATACMLLRHALEEMAERLAEQQIAAERAAHEDRGHES